MICTGFFSSLSVFSVCADRENTFLAVRSQVGARLETMKLAANKTPTNAIPSPTDDE